jgi:YD repeat-containing protein
MEKKIIKSIIIVFGLFILLIIVTTCFSASESYFEDVTYDAKNLPVGIKEIKELDGNKRYYKIRTYRGKILTLSSHDYDGTLRVIDFEERNAAKAEYEYDADGNLIKITKYNCSLKPVKTEIYKPKKKKKL